MSRALYVGRRIGFGLFGLLFAVFIITPTALAAPTTLIDESFTGASTPAGVWTSGGGSGTYGGNACLTASDSTPAGSIPGCTASAPSVDPAGSGVLRLTSSGTFQSGYVLYNQPISSGKGIRISFDQYQYAGGGADGISFFLVDGTKSPTAPGAFGRGLGYASSNDYLGSFPGIEGGYVGVGFDASGGFSAIGTGAGGTATGEPNHIVVRGSEATNYNYVTGVAANGNLRASMANRSDAKRHVVITISPENIMSVSVDYEDGNGLIPELSDIDLNTINGAGTLPNTFKIGFAAGTGTVDDIHEISGLTVTTLPPDLTLSADSGSALRRNASGTLTLKVANATAAGPTTGTITASTTLPAGLRPVSAAGNGWGCTIAGQTVTCSRNGSGAAALSSGAAAPVINLGVRVAANSPSSLTILSQVTTADDSNTANNTASLILPIAADDSAANGQTAGSSTGAAPDTGYGSPHTNPLIALLVYGAGAVTLFGLALLLI
jgi:hypothetical protein